MVTNTKADAHTTFKIPEDALVEVGMIYSVSFCVSNFRSGRAGVKCLMCHDWGCPCMLRCFVGQMEWELQQLTPAGT